MSSTTLEIFNFGSNFVTVMFKVLILCKQSEKRQINDENWSFESSTHSCLLLSQYSISASTKICQLQTFEFHWIIWYWICLIELPRLSQYKSPRCFDFGLEGNIIFWLGGKSYLETVHFRKCSAFALTYLKCITYCFLDYVDFIVIFENIASWD